MLFIKDNHMQILCIFFIYLLIMNLISFILFGVDKKRARCHRYRIPEAVLFIAALLGGAFGGIISMNVFHHKTNKTKFSVGMPLILLIHIVMIVAATVLLSRSV